MYSVLLFLVILTFTAAVPAPNEQYDPAWEANQGWEEVARDPKGIADTLPSPTSLLGKLSSFWTWDR